MLKTTHPFSLILFGASGHLARLKIYPALYILALKKRLPKNYAIVGFARSDMDDESFRALVSQSVRGDIPEVNEHVLDDFILHCHYCRGQYSKKVDFEKLTKRLLDLERIDTDQAQKSRSEWVRLAYLSIPPSVFTDVLDNLCASGIHRNYNKENFRCIIEKPVGNDIKSFEEIQQTLTTCFEEEEIYLLDHYLGKEAVRNVYYLRFANPILERIFKNTLIHHVEITAFEHEGLEGRAGYFDAVGAFRDMFQSHLMMIASLLTMRLQGEDSIKTSRFNALGQFYLPPATDLNETIIQAQCNAYLNEDGVSKKSRTNTFAALKIMSRTSRWDGVPFYLRSGKYMDKKLTRISVAFQEPHPVGKGAVPNRLDIILQGEAGMKLHLQTKLGGTTPSFRPLILEDPLVCVGDCLPEHGLLLLEAIHGKQTWFLSFDEVRSSWRLLDPLQAHLDKPKTPLHVYRARSDGPKESAEWIAKNSTNWME
jgi:glucose-6-phosphate 1-dehydrogenase